MLPPPKPLHWLPVHLQTEHMLLTLLFKGLCDFSPPSRSSPSCTLLSATLVLPVPQPATVQMLPSFLSDSQLAAPFARNSLPQQLQGDPSYTTFKSCLKTHLLLLKAVGTTASTLFCLWNVTEASMSSSLVYPYLHLNSHPLPLPPYVSI